ncbi:hypothetical protein Tco_0405382 [Tanacetum coccineum]
MDGKCLLKAENWQEKRIPQRNNGFTKVCNPNTGRKLLLKSDRPIVSTNGSKVNTNRQFEGTDEQIENINEQRKGTEDHTEEGSATQATQTPTSTIIWENDETNAKAIDFLLAEASRRKREKYTIEERAKVPHDTITAPKENSLLNKDQNAIRNITYQPRINVKSNDDLHEACRKLNHSELKTKKFEEIQALYEKIKRSDEDFISIGSAEDERLIKRMNEKGIDSSKNEMVKEESKEEIKGEKRRRKSTRKRKLCEKENEELRLHLTIAPDEEKEVDYEILDRKYPIKEWKIECL